MAVTNLDNGVASTTVLDRPTVGSVTNLAAGETETVKVGGLVVNTNTISLRQQSAAASASGLLIGGGTDANPATSSTADAKFIELRCRTTATSGDNRLAYLSYNVGAAGGGECLRARTILAATTPDTVHGAHIGLTASSTGAITGLGAGVRGTLEITNTALPANGTYYGGFFEIYSTGATSSVAAVTKHAVLGIGATGNATGAATVLNAIAFDGVSAADTTKMISSVRLTELPANNVGIAVLVNGTRYYIPAVPVAEWN